MFCQTKRLCDRVDHASPTSASASRRIHGDLPQPSRERALRRFAEGKLAMLVATDVAARGIDIDDIGAVIHYEPAKDAKDYLHRSGRTARAGRDGWAVTLVEYNQHTQMRILQRGLRLPNDAAGRGVQQQPEPARPHPLRSRRQDLTSQPTSSGLQRSRQSQALAAQTS